MFRSLLLVVTVITGLAFAQLPACAQTCIVLPTACPNALPDCICKQSDWINSVACCVYATCTSESDINSVISYANGICQPVGVTLPTSQPTNCTSNSTTAATTGSATSSLASSASSVASSMSSAASSVSSAAASASSSALGNRVGVVESAGFVGALLGFFAML